MLKTMSGHKGYVRCCAWTLDSKVIASGRDDKTIRLWSVPDGKRLKFFNGAHFAEVFTVSFSSDEQLMASAGAHTYPIVAVHLPHNCRAPTS